MSSVVPGRTGAIDVTDVVVRFSGTEALSGVSLSVEPGQVVALLGPNGAGKTTLMETIEGYRRPDSGSVLVFGHDPVSDRARVAARWGVMPQSYGLPMGLTVGEAVTLFARLHDSPLDPDDLLATTGLTDLARRRWRRLSGGEQQRLSLAMALAGGPDLLLLDEPTAAVDQAGRDRILSTISERAATGAAVLVTTHRFDDAEEVADRVVILHHGRVVADGTRDELTADEPAITVTIAGRGTTGAESDPRPVAIDLGAEMVELTDGRIRFMLAPTPANVARVTAAMADHDLAVVSVDAGRRSLADTFRALTEEDR